MEGQSPATDVVSLDIMLLNALVSAPTFPEIHRATFKFLRDVHSRMLMQIREEDLVRIGKFHKLRLHNRTRETGKAKRAVGSRTFKKIIKIKINKWKMHWIR